MPNADPLNGKTIGLIADCHVYPPAGPALPAWVFEAFAGCDAILALGDMGEAVVLDQLQAVAPVLGVRGGDDADDVRLWPGARLFQAAGCRIGAVLACAATHKPEARKVQGMLIVNPGSANLPGEIEGRPGVGTVAILRLGDGAPHLEFVRGAAAR